MDLRLLQTPLNNLSTNVHAGSLPPQGRQDTPHTCLKKHASFLGRAQKTQKVPKRAKRAFVLYVVHAAILWFFPSNDISEQPSQQLQSR